MVNFYWIDAFVNGPFSGNPAAVCLLEKPASESWMQGLAAELALSETAFLSPENENFRLRWFTPQTEVKLCGHATLASAAALLDAGHVQAGEAIRFMTLSGELRAWLRKGDGRFELDFPEALAEPTEAPPEMLGALGIDKGVAAAQSGEDWLIEVGQESEVRRLQPDFKALRAIGGRGVCVTARSVGDGADFVSRFFGPAVGINEDPVTGSAHCYLGPWWAGKLGTRELIGRQLSSRGGLVHVSLKNGRAFLSGNASIIVKGNLEVQLGGSNFFKDNQ